ncbi:MAG TPA: hypothetical protein VF867_06090 [Arthrobacter sp.]
MKDQDLARLMAEYDYRIPVRWLRTKGIMLAYEFPPGFESLLTETTKHTSTYVKALRREVFAHNGGWGIPESLDQDQSTGRVLLWAQLHPQRRPPGPDVAVFAKFGDTPDSPKYHYRVEYIFKAGSEPVVPEPRQGTFRQQAIAVDYAKKRAEKYAASAERASRNEKTTYKRRRRLAEGDVVYREIVDRREAHDAELNGGPPEPARARVTNRTNPRGRKRAPRKNWY